MPKSKNKPGNETRKPKAKAKAKAKSAAAGAGAVKSEAKLNAGEQTG